MIYSLVLQNFAHTLKFFIAYTEDTEAYKDHPDAIKSITLCALWGSFEFF